MAAILKIEKPQNFHNFGRFDEFLCYDAYIWHLNLKSCSKILIFRKSRWRNAKSQQQLDLF